MRGRAARSLAAIASLAAAAGCGAGVQHAAIEGAAADPRDPTFVRVTTSAHDEGGLVSVSIHEGDVRDELPATPAPDVLVEMRAHAARRGADALRIERVDTRWRKAFVGLGLADEGGQSVEDCEHAAFAAARAATREAIARCVDRARRARPALRGEVAVIFEIDPFGRAVQAAATPASSKDGEVRRCALRAVYDRDFGAPDALMCRGRVGVTFGDEGSAP